MTFFRRLIPIAIAWMAASPFVHGQVPASALTAAALAGKTLNLTIEDGDPPLETGGTLQLSAGGNVYARQSAGAATITFGSWSHQSAAPAADAVLTLGNFFPDGATAMLSLLDSGNFELKRVGAAARQFGRFTVSPAAGPLPGTPPAITVQPVSQLVDFKSAVSFGVTATDVPGLVYQWRKDGVAIAGLTSPTLALPSATAADIGVYSVVVASPQGVAASADATLAIRPAPPQISVQPVAATGYVGGAAAFSVVATGYPEPAYRWKLGGENVPGGTAATYRRTGLVVGHAGSYTCTVSNSAGSVTSNPALLKVLAQPGKMDTDFPDPAAVPDQSTVSAVSAVFPLSNGKLLVGGSFSQVGGAIRPGLFRTTSGGGLDTAYGVAFPTGSQIFRIVGAPNNKVYIVGWFSSYGGVAQQLISRLNLDGSLDTSFQSFGAVNTLIYDLAVQADGKVVIVGAFDFAKGAARSRIARLNTDGTLDTTFNNGGLAISDVINRVAIGADGRIFIGGKFLTVHGVSRPRIAAMTTAGALDTTFDPGSGFDGEIQALQFQPDGKLLVGGSHGSYNGRLSRCITRIFDDGAWDPSFVPAALTGVGAGIYAIAVQPNGKILAGGNFSKVDTTTRSGITRLLPGGAADPGFNPGVGAGGSTPTVNAITLKGDTIILGGAFTQLAGTNQMRLARLTGDSVSPMAPQIVTQPAALSVRAGEPATLTVLAEAYPVSHQWLKNGVAIPGETFPSLSFQAAATGDAADYSVRVSNASGTVTSDAAALTVDASPRPGSLDPSFRPPSAIFTRLNAVLPLDDGKFLIGGSYSSTLSSGLARVKADGTRDTTFATKVGGTVLALLRQPDGKILVAGQFSSVTTSSAFNRAALVRLNADGSLDTSFFVNANANTAIYALALQPDGKILISGLSYSGGGMVVRLQSDGILDSSFGLSAVPNGAVTGIALQPDGKVVISGEFSAIGGTVLPGVVRVTSIGVYDSSLPVTSAGLGFTPNHFGVAVQSTGRLLLAGTDGKIYRRNLDGTASGSFAYIPADTGNQVIRILSLPDDRLLVVKYYAAPADGGPPYRIIRLGADGAADPSFVSAPGADDFIAALALTPDGRIAVGGDFTVLNGKFRPGVALLRAENPNGPRFEIQPLAKSSVSGGSVTFTALAAGNPVPTYQWRLNGLSILGATSPSFTVNPVLPSAVGDYSVLAVNSAGSAVSAAAALRIARPPVIASQPADARVLAGSSVTFTVAAESPIQPLNYQWRKNGQPVSGATGPSLVLASVAAADAADYDVVVGNADGATDSTVAKLALGAPLGAFENFILGHGLDPLTNGAPDADPDRDGLNNLFEYIAGGNPTLAGTHAPPAAEVRAGVFSYEFDRRKDFAAAGIAIETGAGLNSWQDAVHGVDGVTISITPMDAATDRVTVSFPANAAHRFVRVVIR